MTEALAIPDSHITNLPEMKRQADLRIEIATYWAQKLMDVVEKRNMATTIQGKKYLQVEGWQVVGELCGVTPIVEWTRPWMDGDQKRGYEARVNIVDRDGRIVSSGESSCGFDAFPCRGKTGSEQEKAARSAAQTWAASRAYRNKFGFVAKLAGYEPTPSEEMSIEMPIDNPTSEPLRSSGRARQAAKIPPDDGWRTDFKDALTKLCGTNTTALAFLGTHGYESWEQVPTHAIARDIYKAKAKEKA